VDFASISIRSKPISIKTIVRNGSGSRRYSSGNRQSRLQRRQFRKPTTCGEGFPHRPLPIDIRTLSRGRWSRRLKALLRDRKHIHLSKLGRTSTLRYGRKVAMFLTIVQFRFTLHESLVCTNSNCWCHALGSSCCCAHQKGHSNYVLLPQHGVGYGTTVQVWVRRKGMFRDYKRSKTYSASHFEEICVESAC